MRLKKGFAPLEIPQKPPKKAKFLTGFTLLEVLIAAGILVVALVSMLAGVNVYFDSVEHARNTTIAAYAAQFKMEEIKNYFYGSYYTPAQIVNLYNNTSFDPFDIYRVEVFDSSSTYTRGRGYITVAQNTGFDPSWIDVRIVVCWVEKGVVTSAKKRVTGEDDNLNGALDAGEDANLNGIIDSPVELRTAMVSKW